MQKNRKLKKLTFEYINRVKIEKAEEFQESIFEDVYYSACKLTRKIVKDNEWLEENMNDVDNRTDEQFCNVIAFLGGRGMGKSSAMRSFTHYLENYVSNNAADFKVDTQLTSPYFSVLPRIDTSMIQSEDIMDIILAKMWDTFEKRSELTHKHEMYLKELKDDFNKMKKSYEIYKKAQSGSGIIQNMTSIREMHELAVCLNLREDFIGLVENYLELVLCDRPCSNKDRFLVIAIDDLDLVMKDAYSILEQIRLFLMIPKVIVFVTADMDRLTMVCNKRFTEDLICRDNCEEYEKQRMRDYAASYLDKLFPQNMRIYMPKIGTFAGVECEIIVGGEHFDEKRLLLISMAKYSRIFYMPYDWRGHFLQKDNLRKIVNNLYLLVDISEQDQNEQFDLMCAWYTTELSEYCKCIQNSNLRQELLEMYNGSFDKAYINAAVQTVLIRAINDTNMTARIGFDYGDILLLLDIVSYQESVYNFTILAFSVLLARAKRIKNRSIYCGFRVFNSLLAWQNNTQNLIMNNRCGMEKKRSLGDLLDLNLVYSKSRAGEDQVLKILDANKDKVLDIVRIAILSAMNICDPQQSFYLKWDYSQTENPILTREINNVNAGLGNTNLDTTEIRCIIPVSFKSWSVTISIDNLFFEAPYYENYIRGAVHSIYMGLSEYFGIQKTEEEINAHIKQILSDPIWCLEEYEKWKQKYNISSIMDILPLESVDLMHYIAKNMRDILSVGGWQLQADGCTLFCLQEQLHQLFNTLEEVEKYYESNFLKYQKYSEIISEYLAIIRITDLSPEYSKKLDMPAFNNTPSALPL